MQDQKERIFRHKKKNNTLCIIVTNVNIYLNTVCILMQKHEKQSEWKKNHGKCWKSYTKKSLPSDI
jgi:hypothetical protein